MTDASVNEVKELLRGLEVGEPKQHDGLSLFPLFGAVPALEYLLAAEAFGLGLLRMEEVDGGRVEEIVAVNDAPLPVLLVDGEHLEGALQNRIINVSVLLPAKMSTHLPVSCVEQGRWHYDSSSHFEVSPDHSYAGLRRTQAEGVARAARTGSARRADQGAVWQEVASKHKEMDVAPPTGAMSASYDGNRSKIGDMMRTFGAPEPGQAGVLVAINGSPAVVDLFDRPITLTKMWKRLISGYAMDSLGGRRARPSQSAAKGFLHDAANAEATMHKGVGLGMDAVMTSPNVVGNALTWQENVVHLALFARRAVGIGDDSPADARRVRRRYFHGA